VKAKISEIFYSIQGEGIYQFLPQIFVRFWGCNLNCSFCDSKDLSFELKELDEVIEDIFSFKSFWHSISLTGGEPLLQKDFLRELCENLKDRGQIIYLESNGTLYGNLEEVIKYVDIIAMDFKLPSSTGERAFWEEHRRFLKIAEAKEVFVKAVVTLSTERKDLIKACQILREVNPKIPFVLQPVFSYEVALYPKLEELKKIALDFLFQVEIIPQLHKHLTIR